MTTDADPHAATAARALVNIKDVAERQHACWQYVAVALGILAADAGQSALNRGILAILRALNGAGPIQ